MSQDGQPTAPSKGYTITIEEPGPDGKVKTYRGVGPMLLIAQYVNDGVADVIMTVPQSKGLLQQFVFMAQQQLQQERKPQ